MTSLTRRYRFLTFLCALIQMGLPGALGVVDAMSASEGRDSRSHIEETTGKQCHGSHSTECLVCRLLATGATGADPAPAIVTMAGDSELTPASASNPRSIRHRTFQSRAPPTS